MRGLTHEAQKLSGGFYLKEISKQPANHGANRLQGGGMHHETDEIGTGGRNNGLETEER